MSLCQSETNVFSRCFRKLLHFKLQVSSFIKVLVCFFIKSVFVCHLSRQIRLPLSLSLSSSRRLVPNWTPRSANSISKLPEKALLLLLQTAALLT